MSQNSLEDLNFLINYLQFTRRRGKPRAAAWARLILAAMGTMDSLNLEWRQRLLSALDERDVLLKPEELLPKNDLPLSQEELFQRLLSDLLTGHNQIGQKDDQTRKYRVQLAEIPRSWTIRRISCQTDTGRARR